MLTANEARKMAILDDLTACVIHRVGQIIKTNAEDGFVACALDYSHFGGAKILNVGGINYQLNRAQWQQTICTIKDYGYNVYQDGNTLRIDWSFE